MEREKRRKLWMAFAFLFAALVFVSIETASASTIYVPDIYTKIQWAVNASSAGDTIIIRDGTYIENVNIDKRLTIRSENGSASTVVQAENSDAHVFVVTANSVDLSGFTIRGAYGGYKMGIFLEGADNCNISGNSIDDNNGGIYLSTSNYNTLRDNIVQYSYSGINLHNSNNNNLMFNEVKCNMYSTMRNESKTPMLGEPVQAGISLEGSNNNTLTYNFAEENRDGIVLFSSSNYNRLVGNGAYHNWKFGIILDHSSNNELTGNYAELNYLNGIALWNSANNNSLTENIASFNKKGSWMGDYPNGTGIVVYHSSNNELTGNYAESNDNYGIMLYGSSNNLVYNNYFNNTNNSYDDGTNIWNVTKSEGTNIIFGLYLGGNYWSDYAGEDTNGDGLGDTPYDIPGGTNEDYLPLTERSDTTPPIITFVSPTPANNSDVTRTYVFVNITINEPCNTAILNWNGTNETMLGTETNFYLNKTGLSNGMYTYKVYANDTSNNWNVSETRFITINFTGIPVYFKPFHSTVPIGEEFVVNVTVGTETVAASNIMSDQIDFSFNPNVLQVVSVVSGPYMPSSGYPTFPMVPTVDNANGTVTGAAEAISGGHVAPTGTGVIWTITFNATAKGSSNINFTRATLLNQTLKEIPVAIINGTVTVIEYGSISGTVTELCCDKPIQEANVTVSQNGTIINSTTSNDSGCYSIVNLRLGSYNVTISKTYIERPSMNCAVNNTTVAVQPGQNTVLDIKLRHISDMYIAPPSCCIVDVFDLSVFATAWNTCEGDGKYNPIADLNEDGCIDVWDLSIFSLEWGADYCAEYRAMYLPEYSDRGQEPMKTSIPVYFEPLHSTVPVDEEFVVNVTVGNETVEASNIMSDQIDFRFNPKVLQVVSVVSGPYLPSSGYPTFPMVPTIDNVNGTVTGAAEAISDRHVAPNGTGVIWTITFNATAKGTSNINITTVTLLNPALKEIPVAIINGSATVTDITAMPDLVITEKWICWPDNCTICYNVTNTGNGTTPAGHNTTLYVDVFEVAHDFVTEELAPGENYTGCFDDYIWAYTPPEDNIAVCADSDNTIAESNETNNCAINTWMCGDANEDGTVNVLDVLGVYRRALDPNYPLKLSWAGDVNCDGEINVLDVLGVYRRALDPNYDLEYCCERE